MSIDFQAIVFVIMAALAILGALGCVFSRRVAHSLLSLMLTFFAVAGVFVLLVLRCWQQYKSLFILGQ